MTHATGDPLIRDEVALADFEASGTPVSGSVSSTDDRDSNIVADTGQGDTKLMLRLPRSVHERLLAQARLERRQVRVVMEYAIEVFIKNEIREPRPYLPYQYRAEDKVETQIRISDELSVDLGSRAFEEERTRNVLALRALLDYLESHEGRGDDR